MSLVRGRAEGQRFAKDNPMQAEFEKHVDEIEHNTYTSRDVVVMGVTPKVLQDIGFSALPIAMTKNHIYSVAVSKQRAISENRYDSKYNYHDLGFSAVKDIYEKLSNPLMVIAHPDFVSKKKRDSTHKVIVFVDLSISNKQVIAPIEIDFDAKYNNKSIDVYLVSTYFNKNNISDLIKEAIALETQKKTGFYYLDKKRTQSIIKRAGFQLSGALNNLSSDIIIKQIDDNVNRKISDITQSKQFIDFFGDWQNHPESASKVVDKDCKPLVVYHDTGSDFNVFDKNRIGQHFGESRGDTLGFYFTPYEGEAKGYAREAAYDTGQERVVGAYLSLKNPLIVEDSGWGSAIEQADIRHRDLMRWAKAGNHDGIIVVSTDEEMEDGSFDTVYIAFEPTQIKSATDNIGTFDKYDPDIRYSKDDTIYDLDDDADELLFTSDGDLSFDGYGTIAGKVINVEQLMQEQGAEQAIYTLYNAADNAVM